MNLKYHLFIGSIFFLLFYIFLLLVERQGLLKITHENPIPIFSAGACVALYGSVLPDIDTVKSKIFIATILSFSLLCIYGFYTNSTYITRLSLLLILLVIAFLLLGHRKITHKWTATFLYSIITGFAFVNLYIGLFGFVGYGSHLITDKISTRKKRLPRI